MAIVVVYYNSQYSNKTANEQESHKGPIGGGYFEVYCASNFILMF